MEKTEKVLVDMGVSTVVVDVVLISVVTLVETLETVAIDVTDTVEVFSS
jgi:hypothetical protein